MKIIKIFYIVLFVQTTCFIFGFDINTNEINSIDISLNPAPTLSDEIIIFSPLNENEKNALISILNSSITEEKLVIAPFLLEGVYFIKLQTIDKQYTFSCGEYGYFYNIELEMQCYSNDLVDFLRSSFIKEIETRRLFFSDQAK